MLKIDKNDRQLLHQLQLDARQSISQMARHIGVGKELCLYRLRRLEQEGLIKGYYPIIDLSGLGYYQLRLQLKYGVVGENERKQLISFLKHQPIVSWLYDLGGHWDLVVLFAVKQLKDYEQFYDAFINQFGHLFQDKLLTIATRIHHFLRNQVTGTNDRKAVITGEGKSCELIEMDFAILKLLLKDARMPLQDIALHLPAPITTVKYRLHRMEQLGIIKGYRPQIDITLLGLENFKVQATLLNPQQRKLAMEIVAQDTHTNYITESIGPFDLEFEADYTQISALVRYLDELSKTIPIKIYDIIFDNRAIKINDIPL